MLLPVAQFFITRLNNFVAEFHPRSLPPMLRANYARELFSWMLLPLMLGALEGGTMAIIVKKMFAGADGVGSAELDFAVAAVSAAPNVANLTSFIWVALAHGRQKVKFISILQIVTCGCVAIGVGLFANELLAGVQVGRLCGENLSAHGVSPFVLSCERKGIPPLLDRRRS